MKEITAEDKNKVLEWFYEADVNGNEMPQDVLPERSQEICAILLNDGYTTKGEYRGMLTLKGQSFFLNGGYVKERAEKERPIRIAEEANKKARNANFISLLAIVLSIAGFFYTNYMKNASVQPTEGIKSIITDSISNSTSINEDTFKTVNPKNAAPMKNQSQEQNTN